MKSFEGLVLAHLKTIPNSHLEPLQFAHKANRSIISALNMALVHQQLDSPGTSARILFVDSSSAVISIFHSLQQDKLSKLHVSDSICRWISDFLSDRKQHVNLGETPL